MRLSWKAIAAGVLLASASTTSFAVPTCSSTTDWASVGPGIEFFSNLFSSPRTYDDCYTFSLSGDAKAFAGVGGIDWFSNLDIDVTSVSLFSNDSSIGAAQSPQSFVFDDLTQGGLYTLVVNSVVTLGPSGLWNAPVGYFGLIGAMPGLVADDPTRVPEPTTLTLLGLGLVTAAVVRRRRGVR
jgi:hypothetical protein